MGRPLATARVWGLAHWMGVPAGSRALKKVAVPQTSFLKEDDSPMTKGLLKKSIVGRQLFGGPICERLAPFWTPFCSLSRRQGVVDSDRLAKFQ